MKRISIFLLTGFSFLFQPTELSSIDIDEKHAKEYSKLRFENNKKHQWKKNYESTLQFIKKREGYHKGAAYIDLSGTLLLVTDM
jgi:hypothetical protein